MQLARGEGDGQRLARSQQMALADHVGDRRGAQAFGERGRGVRGIGQSGGSGRRGSEQVGHGIPGNGSAAPSSVALPRMNYGG